MRIRPIERVNPIERRKQKRKMSYAYFEDPIKCPECGQDSRELYHVISVTKQKILMCEGCRDDPDETSRNTIGS